MTIIDKMIEGKDLHMQEGNGYLARNETSAIEHHPNAGDLLIANTRTEIGPLPLEGVAEMRVLEVMTIQAQQRGKLIALDAPTQTAGTTETAEDVVGTTIEEIEMATGIKEIAVAPQEDKRALPIEITTL